MINWLLACPLIGILVILLLPRNSVSLIRLVALAATVVAFVLSLCLLTHFDPSATQMQFTYLASWIPQLHANYQVGVDGISLPLI